MDLKSPVQISSTINHRAAVKRFLAILAAFAVVGSVAVVATKTMTVQEPRSIITSTTISQSASSLSIDNTSAPLPYLPEMVSSIVATNKANLTQWVATNVPASAGNCKEANPPKPCFEMGNLYYEKATMYEVTARWITGLNNVRFDQVDFSYDAEGKMTLRLKIHFKALPASVRIEKCLRNLCGDFSDGTNTCCGTDKVVTIVATATCSESAPFVRNLKFQTATITPIIVQVHLALGKKITRDITPAIEGQIKSLDTNKVVNVVNTQIQKVVGSGKVNVRCKA